MTIILYLDNYQLSYTWTIILYLDDFLLKLHATNGDSSCSFINQIKITTLQTTRVFKTFTLVNNNFRVLPSHLKILYGF